MRQNKSACSNRTFRRYLYFIILLKKCKLASKAKEKPNETNIIFQEELKIAWNIGTASRVEVTMICDSTIDTLYMDPPGVSVKRLGLGHAFDPAKGLSNMPAKTIEKLKEIAPKVIIPQHCTGFRASAEIMNAFPEEYVQTSAGMTVCMPFVKHEHPEMLQAALTAKKAEMMKEAGYRKQGE